MEHQEGAASAEKDARLPVLTGYASRRAFAVRRELMARAKSAHHASAVATDDREKAALRGKAKGLIEAAELVRALERGERLRKRLRNLSTRVTASEVQR